AERDAEVLRPAQVEERQQVDHPYLAQPPRPERERFDPLVDRVDHRREGEPDRALAPGEGHDARLQVRRGSLRSLLLVIARSEATSEATRQSRAAARDALDCFASLAMTKPGWAMGALLTAPRPVA